MVPTGFEEVHPFVDIEIGVHAVGRYIERAGWLGYHFGYFTPRQEIGILLALSEPCEGLSQEWIDAARERHGNNAVFWHTPPFWRWVIDPDAGTLITVEADVYPYCLGPWRDVKEAAKFVELHGFTVKEITGGVIKTAHKTMRKGGRHAVSSGVLSDCGVVRAGDAPEPHCVSEVLAVCTSVHQGGDSRGRAHTDESVCEL